MTVGAIQEVKAELWLIAFLVNQGSVYLVRRIRTEQVTQLTMVTHTLRAHRTVGLQFLHAVTNWTYR
ncbi:hypothetical protein AB4114_11940 [Paenibacillus sp. 2RAB27]|uniref:hypothetical protein n=1 Tax=Paenibacillus sp. 2RAB27 TaxID=3232991 RepID=UPI003F9A3193